MIYFTADPHFGHNLLAQYRGFETPEWDRFFLDKINSRVTKQDTLWILGDFGFHGVTRKIKQKIACRDLRLIIGNHDSPKDVNLFKHAWHQRLIKVNDQRVYLSHYPHFFWDKSHYGAFHLYGHVHGEKEGIMDALLPSRRSIDVGPENYKRFYGEYGIWSWDEVFEILKDQPGHHKVDGKPYVQV